MNLMNLSLLLLISACSSAFAQAWPAKPIRVVAALSGSGETSARAFAQEISQALGQPVVVESQSGAGGGQGAQTVARAPADGYTLLYATLNSQVFRLFLVKDVG